MFGARIKHKGGGAVPVIDSAAAASSFTPDVDEVARDSQWDEPQDNISNLNREITDIRRQLDSRTQLETRLRKLQIEKRARLEKHIEDLKAELEMISHDAGDVSAAAEAEDEPAWDAPAEKAAVTIASPDAISMVPDEFVVAASGAAMEPGLDRPQPTPVERAQSIDELVAAVDQQIEIPQGFSVSNNTGRRILGKAGWKWTLKEIWAGRMGVDMLPEDYGFKSKLIELKGTTGETPAAIPVAAAEPKKEEAPKSAPVTPWSNSKETLTAPEPIAIREEQRPLTEEEKTRAALMAKLNKIRSMKGMAPVQDTSAPATAGTAPAALAAPQSSANEAPASAAPVASLIEQMSDLSLIQDPPGREESTMKALLTGDYRFLRAQTSGLTPAEKKQLMEDLRTHKIADDRYQELLTHIASPSVILTDQMAEALARAAYASPAKDALKTLEIFARGEPELAAVAFNQSGTLRGEFFSMLLEKLPTPVNFERFIESLEQKTKSELLQPSVNDPDGARKKREALGLIIKHRESFAKLEEVLYGERLAYWKEFKRIEHLAVAAPSADDARPADLGSAFSGRGVPLTRLAPEKPLQRT